MNKNSKFSFFVGLILFVFFGILYAGAVEEVTVKADFIQEVSSEKADLDIKFAKEDIIKDIIPEEKHLFEYSPKSLVNVLPAMPKIVYSNNTVQPQLINILEDPVLRFRTETLVNLRFKKWSFNITDARGEMFKTIKGKKGVPYIIEWDGKGDSGDMIIPGQWYAYNITIRDEYNDMHTMKGETFRVKGLFYEDNESNQVISLSLVDIFNLNSAGLEIRKEGKQLLDEALDIIKIFYEYPMVLVIYDRDEAVGFDRGQKVLDYMLNNLSVEELNVNIDVVPSYISEYRIEIVILNDY